MVKVQFRSVKGDSYQLDVEPNTTIGEAKRRLEEEFHLPSNNLKMILTAKILSDDQTISSLNIPAGAFIVVHSVVPRKPQPKPKPKAEVKPASETEDEKPPNEDTASKPKPPPKPESPSPPPASSNTNPSSKKPGDPPNFEQLVNDLAEMGFERVQCEQALRMQSYNMERAANLLLTGELSSSSPPPGGQSRNRNSDDDPASGVNFGQFQSVYDNFSADEKASISRLLRYADPETVIQYFMACDKNEEQTLGLLT